MEANCLEAYSPGAAAVSVPPSVLVSLFVVAACCESFPSVRTTVYSASAVLGDASQNLSSLSSLETPLDCGTGSEIILEPCCGYALSSAAAARVINHGRGANWHEKDLRRGESTAWNYEREAKAH